VTDFLQSATPGGIASLNAHYNHYELESADGSSLAGTADVTAAIQSRILFAMGCHSGLNVADTLGGTTGKFLDWPEVYAKKLVAMYIGNTGYGYGDSASVALSERLLSLFATRLHSDSGSVGEQWVAALNDYFATAGAYDVYDEKVMEETTFYGLPFWRFSTAGTVTPPPPLPTSPDPATGTPSSIVTFDPTTIAPHTQFGLYRPNLAIRSTEVTANAGPARGLWINDLTTSDAAGSATLGYPTIDLAAHEPKPNVPPIFFPASPFTLEHSNTFGKQHDFINVSDQFRPGATLPVRQVIGAQFKVLYSFSADTNPPLISLVNVARTGTSNVVSARITDDTGVSAAAALVHTTSTHWDTIPLVRSTSDPTLFVSAAFLSTVDPEVFVEATDNVNVAYSANKGVNFTSTTAAPTPGPQIFIQSPLGPYQAGQAVNATFSCVPNPANVSSCVGTVPNGNAVDTTSPGLHSFTVKATDSDGNATSLVRQYVVQFPFRGFFQPVDNEPTLNVVSAGRGIPVKFSLGGNRGLDIFASGFPVSQPIVCPNQAATDLVDQTLTAGQSSLSYDSGNDTYLYVWKTDASWANTCRALIVKTRDGAVHRALFSFKK